MKIETMNNIEIAYKRFVGPYGVNNVLNMESFKDHISVKRIITEHSVIYACALDTPQTPPYQQRYDIGLTAYNKNTNDLDIQRIATSDYAIFELDHTETAIMEFWSSFDTIVQTINMNPLLPILERYDPNLLKHHKCEICVPII